MLCPHCGKELGEGVKFCGHCGAAVAEAKKAPGAEKAHGSVGYSAVINDPRFLQAAKKNKRSNAGCAWIFVLLPFIALTIFSLISDEMEPVYGMAIGGGISALFLVVYLLFSLKNAAQKPWEGTVEKRYEKTIRRRNEHKDAYHDYYDEPHGIVVIWDTRGKKHKIDERLDTPLISLYHYLKMGDRVRFHAGMGLSFPYEKYDKSKDDSVVCVFCRRRAPITETDCPHCHGPLLK